MSATEDQYTMSPFYAAVHREDWDDVHKRLGAYIDPLFDFMSWATGSPTVPTRFVEATRIMTELWGKLHGEMLAAWEEPQEEGDTTASEWSGPIDADTLYRLQKAVNKAHADTFAKMGEQMRSTDTTLSKVEEVVHETQKRTLDWYNDLKEMAKLIDANNKSIAAMGARVSSLADRIHVMEDYYPGPDHVAKMIDPGEYPRAPMTPLPSDSYDDDFISGSKGYRPGPNAPVNRE